MLTEAFLPALIVFLLAFAGMAIGVIVSNRRITGSCGGLNAVPGADHCNVCGRSLRDATEDGCDKRG
jgi:hypothetical protein